MRKHWSRVDELLSSSGSTRVFPAGPPGPALPPAVACRQVPMTHRWSPRLRGPHQDGLNHPFVTLRRPGRHRQ
jgi:hypothetical protein